MNIRSPHPDKVILCFNPLIEAINDYIKRQSNLSREKLDCLQNAIDALYQDVSPGFHFSITGMTQVALPTIEELDGCNADFFIQKNAVKEAVWVAAAHLFLLDDALLKKAVIKAKGNIEALFYTSASTTSQLGLSAFPVEIKKEIFSHLDESTFQLFNLAIKPSKSDVHGLQIIQALFFDKEKINSRNKNRINLLCGWIRNPEYLLDHENVLNHLREFNSLYGVFEEERILATACLAIVAAKLSKEDELKLHVSALMRWTQCYLSNHIDISGRLSALIAMNCLVFIAEKNHNVESYNLYLKEMLECFSKTVFSSCIDSSSQGYFDRCYQAYEIIMKLASVSTKRKIFCLFEQGKELFDILDKNIDHVAYLQGEGLAVQAFFILARDIYPIGKKDICSDFNDVFKNALFFIFRDNSVGVDRQGYDKKCADRIYSLINKLDKDFFLSSAIHRNDSFYSILCLLEKNIPNFVDLLISSMVADYKERELKFDLKKTIADCPALIFFLLSTKEKQEKMLKRVRANDIKLFFLLFNVKGEHYLYLNSNKRSLMSDYNFSHDKFALLKPKLFQFVSMLLTEEPVKYEDNWIDATRKAKEAVLQDLHRIIHHCLVCEIFPHVSLSSVPEENIFILFQCMQRMRKIQVGEETRDIARSVFELVGEQKLYDFYQQMQNKVTDRNREECIQVFKIILDYLLQIKNGAGVRIDRDRFIYCIKHFCSKMQNASTSHLGEMKALVLEDNKSEGVLAGVGGVLKYIHFIEYEYLDLNILDEHKNSLLAFIAKINADFLTEQDDITRSLILGVCWKLINSASKDLSEAASIQVKQFFSKEMALAEKLSAAVSFVGAPLQETSVYYDFMNALLGNKATSSSAISFLKFLCQINSQLYVALQLDQLNINNEWDLHESRFQSDSFWMQGLKHINLVEFVLDKIKAIFDDDGKCSNQIHLNQMYIVWRAIARMYQNIPDFDVKSTELFSKIDHELAAVAKQKGHQYLDYAHQFFYAVIIHGKHGFPFRLYREAAEKYLHILDQVEPDFFQGRKWFARVDYVDNCVRLLRYNLFKMAPDLFYKNRFEHLFEQRKKKGESLYFVVPPDEVKVMTFCSKMRTGRSVSRWGASHGLFMSFKRLEMEQIFLSFAQKEYDINNPHERQRVLSEFKTLCGKLGMNLLQCVESAIDRLVLDSKMKLLSLMSDLARNEKRIDYRFIQCAKMVIASIFAVKQTSTLFAFIEAEPNNFLIKCALAKYCEGIFMAPDFDDVPAAQNIVKIAKALSLPQDDVLWEKVHKLCANNTNRLSHK